MVNFLFKKYKFFKKARSDIFLFSHRKKTKVNISLNIFFNRRFFLKYMVKYTSRFKYSYYKPVRKFFAKKRKILPKKFSYFKMALQERQKLRFYYNISFSVLKKYFSIYSKKRSSWEIKFLYFIENRLDVILFKSNFFKTMLQVRQSLAHKKILVNWSKVDKPNFLLKKFDLVFSKSYIKGFLLFNKSNLIVNYKYNFFILVKNFKKFKHLNYPFKLDFNKLFRRF